MLLTTVVFNLAYGPWKGSAWWRKLQEGGAELAATAGVGDQLLEGLYGAICQNLGAEAFGTRIPLRTNTNAYLGWGIFVAALVCEICVLCPTTYEHPVSAWTFCPFVGHLLCSFSAPSCDKDLFFIGYPRSLKNTFLQETVV